MPTQDTAIVLGASGSVGHALVAHLLATRAFARVVTLVRRALPEQAALAEAAGITLQQVVLPKMDPAQLSAAATQAAAAAQGAVGLSVLGVGAGTAKMTLDQHRAVDVDLNVAFARGLAASGKVRHLALMSAAGANPHATTRGSGAPGLPRFNRVKGEAEQAVQGVGLDVVSIFRPATILGSRHTPRLLEMVLPAFAWVTPARFRSITVQQLAAAMVAAAAQTPASSATYHYPEMLALARPR